jgi:hypothetical protein
MKFDSNCTNSRVCGLSGNSGYAEKTDYEKYQMRVQPMKNIRNSLILFISGMAVFLSVCTGWTATFNASTPEEFQNVLTAASANSQDDVMTLSAGTYILSAPLTFDSSENYALTISGAGKGSTILNGGNAHQILSVSTIQAEASVLIQNMSFQNAELRLIGRRCKCNGLCS